MNNNIKFKIFTPKTPGPFQGHFTKVASYIETVPSPYKKLRGKELKPKQTNQSLTLKN